MKAIAKRLSRLEDQLGPADGKPRERFRIVVRHLGPESGFGHWARLTTLLQYDSAALFSLGSGSNEPDITLALARAAEANDAAALQRILAVNVAQDDKDNALMQASQSGNATAMSVLINHGANAAGLLCLAVEAQNTRSVEVLARLPSVKPNEFCGEGRYRETPLNIAFKKMEFGHINTTDIIRVLLSIPGIDPNIPSSLHERPLFAAIDMGDESLVRMLLSTPGIDVNLTNRSDQSAAGQACSAKDSAILKLLLSKGAKDTVLNTKQLKRCAETGDFAKP